MNKWVLPLILILSMLLPLGVHAQDAISFSSLLIQIWPEYDQPAALVIYDLTLSGAATIPAEVSIRIPSAAGEPNAVAARQVDGSLYTMDYSRQVAGDWATISFTTTSPEVRLEYYDPGLTRVDNARHFDYTWLGDYAVTDLVIKVQQPLGASDMRISPSFGSGVTGSDNLVYYTSSVGSISAGTPININIDYQKSSDTLSVESQPIQPSAPISQTVTQNLDLPSWLPWILGVLGAGLIIGGSLWFWQTGRERTVSKKPRKRTRSVPAQPEAISVPGEGGIYCSQCGKRAASGDQFCRSCGTQLRPR